MFERYTEKARRVIFFARYEASHYGCSEIETEHLLLGLLREDKRLSLLYLKPPEGYQALRSRIDREHPDRKWTPTNVDLPLSDESKRVLKYAAEEADRLANRHIGTEHLLLALTRAEKCFAAKLLEECEFDPEKLREDLAVPPSSVPFSFSGSETAQHASRAFGTSAPRTFEEITLHNQPRNADFIRRSVKKLREISWHWQKQDWTPVDVVIHRKTRAVSFNTKLAEDKKHFKLITEGWTKDYCKICHWELFASKDQPEHSTGYTNGRDWLCTECYDKFIARSDFFSSNYPDIT
jgi:hypothetical protein